MTNAQDDVGAVAAIRQAFEAAENAGDADAVAALLTEDAVLVVPDFPTQEGKPACARSVRDTIGWLLTEFTGRINGASAEIVVIGDMAFHRGTFSFDGRQKSAATVRA